MIGKFGILGKDKLKIGQYGGGRKGEIGRGEISGVKGWIYRSEISKKKCIIQMNVSS